jgi:hypothetical protein
MKNSDKTSLVAATVVSALGSAAYALPPNTIVDAVFYAGGSSAQANAVF